MEKLRILELFVGIGACSKALENLGLDIEIVDAVEIDKYAMKSFNAIHGTNFETQDITKWDKDLKDIDIITHGSPCQDFSVAGKQAGGDIGSGTRSSLMYETIRIVGKIRPKYILWENVKNLLSKKHKHNFDAYIETMNILGYNSYYQILDAKDYGVPQHRERVYTVSIRKDIDNGNFKFPEKEELKIRLKDVLEDEVDEKYYLKDKQIERIKTTTYNVGKTRIQEKDYCDTLCARDWKDPKCIQVAKLDIKGIDQIRRVYSKEGLSPSITTCGGGNTEPKILEEKLPGAYGRDFGSKGKVQDIEKECDTLQAAMGNDGGNIPILNQKNAVRKLTPKECYRLMGFDDIDFEKASQVNSNSQLYKQAREQYRSKSFRKNI